MPRAIFLDLEPTVIGRVLIREVIIISLVFVKPPLSGYCQIASQCEQFTQTGPIQFSDISSSDVSPLNGRGETSRCEMSKPRRLYSIEAAILKLSLQYCTA